MEIHFSVLGYGEKRWYQKVAKGAELALNKIVKDQNIPDLELCAEFDSKESEVVKVVIQKEKRHFFKKVYFPCKDWGLMPDAISKATSQLASALLKLIPQNKLNNFEQIFACSNLIKYTVSLDSKVIPDDNLVDVYLYLRDIPNHEKYLEIVDYFETKFIRINHSEISGTGFGLGGGNIDFITKDLKMCKKKIESVLKSLKITNFEITDNSA